MRMNRAIINNTAMKVIRIEKNLFVRMKDLSSCPDFLFMCRILFSKNIIKGLSRYAITTPSTSELRMDINSLRKFPKAPTLKRKNPMAMAAAITISMLPLKWASAPPSTAWAS